MVPVFPRGNRTGEGLSLSHACVLTGVLTQSGLEINSISRMMTYHPAWQTRNVAVPARGQWSCCSGAGSAFVLLWLSRLKDNSADNSWEQRLSLSQQESWFPPPPGAMACREPFSFLPRSTALDTAAGATATVSEPKPTGRGCQALRRTPASLRVCVWVGGGYGESGWGVKASSFLSDSSTQQHSPSKPSFSLMQPLFKE